MRNGTPQGKKRLLRRARNALADGELRRGKERTLSASYDIFDRSEKRKLSQRVLVVGRDRIEEY